MVKAHENNSYRILLIYPGPALPNDLLPYDIFSYAPDSLSGEILQPAWLPAQDKLDRQTFCNAGPDSRRVKNFVYHFNFSFGKNPLAKRISDSIFYLKTAKRLAKFGPKYSCVISYGTTRTAIFAYVIARLLKCPFVVDVPGNPSASFLFERKKPMFLDSLKQYVSYFISSWAFKKASAVHLLYPQQLMNFLLPSTARRFICHDLVPVTHIGDFPSNEVSNIEKYILFLGWPWYLKGVDLLIKAFVPLSAMFPDVRLKIVGFCPDKSPFLEITEGCDRIDFLDPVHRNEAMKLMKNCLFFVLPSRTEAMGRVMLEAWACGKAVIGANVDGIPFYLRDGKTGLLFEREDIEGLRSRLLLLLTHPELAQELGENGRRVALEQYSESAFWDHYSSMIRDLCGIKETSLGQGIQEPTSRKESAANE